MSYMQHLQKDRKLSSIIHEPIAPLQVRSNHVLRLMASIISQQLSTTVAKVIYARFLGLYGDKEPTPADVLGSSVEELRSIGLSNAKTQYVQNVARFCIEEKLTNKRLQKLGNEELLALLTQIKGVGRWTVEMLLMFSLGREDVFAVDDLGIQQSMCRLYKIDATDKKAMRVRMLKIAERWAPFRTYACLHLWKWKDTPALKTAK